ncbi:MAG: glycosyltransferase family 2 protein [Myxococcales bacterium]|nr:glycosyltransferase family 2 protein [Myxococcales bacterium]MCB9714165.1 glycosyltransferase family 2 protein [Myxococcales bacterium]
MKVASVTVNYKTADLALRALEHVLDDIVPLGGRSIVVDNDSQDGSYEKIAAAVRERGWDEHVDVLASGRNAGFGAGNNLAFRHAMSWDDPPEYFYLLNPDAYPDRGTVEHMVRFMEDHPRVGQAGTKVRHPGGELRLSAFRFPSVWSELEQGLHLGLASRLLDRWKVVPEAPEQTGEVDWVSGASVILRRAMLDEIGLFDENFFLYFEETDLAMRAKRAGWSTYYVVEATAEHIGQVSTGIKDTKKRRPRYWFESRAYYLRKNHGRAALLAANTAFAGAYLLHEIRKKLTSKTDQDPHRFFRDFVDFNFGRGLRP